MPKVAVGFGLALVALGLLAYFSPDVLGVGKDGKPAEPGHPSSLSPVGVGGLLLVAGLLSLAAPGLRKHAMHGAAAVGLLGTLGGLVPVILRSVRVEEVAVKVGLGMAVLSAVFVGLCVKSFIDVRKARERAAGVS